MISIKEQPHHHEEKLCTTRAPYRQGRKFTAIKVYTVNNESKYLIVSNVPDLKLNVELCKLCSKYGNCEKFQELEGYPCEKFEKAFLIKYNTEQESARAKHWIDKRSFFGGILRAFYAPELESINDTRKKLLHRMEAVSIGSKYYKKRPLSMTDEIHNRKRKHNITNFPQKPTIEACMSGLNEQNGHLEIYGNEFSKNKIAKEDNLYEVPISKVSSLGGNCVYDNIKKQFQRKPVKEKDTFFNVQSIEFTKKSRNIKNSFPKKRTVIQPDVVNLKKPVDVNAIK